MTELERELRGLAAAIDFPETPEIARTCGSSCRDRRDRSGPVVATSPAVGGRDRGRRRRRACGRAAGADRRSCTCSGSARCASSSSTACRRSGPSAARARHRDRSCRRAVLRCSARPCSASPTASIAKGRVVTLLYGTPERVRAPRSRRSRRRASRRRSARSSPRPGTRVEFVADPRRQPGRRSGSPARLTSCSCPAARGRLAAQHADLGARPADAPARRRRDPAAGAWRSPKASADAEPMEPTPARAV